MKLHGNLDLQGNELRQAVLTAETQTTVGLDWELLQATRVRVHPLRTWATKAQTEKLSSVINQ